MVGTQNIFIQKRPEFIFWLPGRNTPWFLKLKVENADMRTRNKKKKSALIMFTAEWWRLCRYLFPCALFPVKHAMHWWEICSAYMNYLLLCFTAMAFHLSFPQILKTVFVGNWEKISQGVRYHLKTGTLC